MNKWMSSSSFYHRCCTNVGTGDIADRAVWPQKCGGASAGAAGRQRKEAQGGGVWNEHEDSYGDGSKKIMVR